MAGGAVATFGQGTNAGIPLGGVGALSGGIPGSNATQAAPQNNAYYNGGNISVPGGGAAGGSPTDGSGALNGGGSGGGGAYAPQIGSIDAQMAGLNGTLGTIDSSQAHGLTGLQDQYNQKVSDANQNHGYAVQDFNTQEQNDNLNHQQAIDQVGTHARTLANSVRQMIGSASGSGSSAYQLTAPGAVQRQADLGTQNINDNFGQNMSALTTAKQREDAAYQGPNGLLGQLANALTQNQNAMKTSYAGQRQQINSSLGDLAAQRAAYMGGGLGATQAAAAPYTANVQAQTDAINNIANSYQSPFSSIAPVKVAAPTLRDYVTGQSSAQANPDGTQSATTASFNPLATWLGKDQSQNQYSF